MKPTFEPIDDGLEIIDPIERHRYRLTTHEPVSLEAVDTDRIQFPVASAVETTAEMITLPTNDTVYVRDGDGSMVAEVRPDKQASLPSGRYTIDLSGPLKVYARVDSAVYIYSDSEHTYITLDESTAVTFGARSYHRRPAGTITSTAEPTDVMKAVSMFGSALKSTTPERSYPTHRGHPPTVELGDELSIPGKLEQPNTGITITIPPTLDHVFTVTPLAYYLGAEVVPGSKPQITNENGYTTCLAKNEDIELSVKRVLKQVFFLDCVVRTEGATPLPLHERQVVEPKLEFNIETVYDKNLSEQFKAYLSEPFDKIDAHFPEWRPETRLEPTDKMIGFLPFVADILSVVNIQNEKPQLEKNIQTEAIDEFTRNELTRSTDSIRGTDSGPAHEKQDRRTSQQSWNNDDSPDIISETPLSAFYNGLGQTPRDDPIEIEVVCNDLDMREESDTVNGVYGTREDLSFDITIKNRIKCGELRNTLESEIDFLHFIGHIDENGFECPDGKLDVSSLTTCGVKAFFLNACKSRNQGMHLVEAGSIGGVVTLDNVINSGAVEIGCTIARLLNQGFPLYAALDVARRSSVLGQQYFIVGNGMTTIAQSEAGPPLLCKLDNGDKNTGLNITSFMTVKYRKGSLFIPYLDGNDTYHLTSGSLCVSPLSKSQIEEFLQLEDTPVVANGDVFWDKNLILNEI